MRRDELADSLKDAFSKIKEEFAEHLDAINANTNEVQANYEYICKLDEKIDKVNERLDEMQMVLSALPSHSPGLEKKPADIRTLTVNEKKIFLVMYLSESPLGYTVLAEKIGLSEQLVMDYITTMIAKGIPLVKKYLNNAVLITLDEDFKRLQAKENVLEIDEEIVNSVRQL